MKNAYKEGQTITQLARTFQLDRRTIKKYIHLPTWSPSRQVRRKAINEYVTQALEWEKEGHSVMTIYRYLQQLGYTGGYDAVKRLVREEKRKRNATTLQTFSVSRRKIVALLWKPRQEDLEEERELLHHYISLAPPLQTFKSRVNRFIMHSTILQQNCFPNGYKINFLTPLLLFTVMLSEYAVTFKQFNILSLLLTVMAD